MTVIGAILTSLVIAREWERGTMEALLSTQVTRTELLLSKLLPYYVLGLLAMTLCMVVAVFVMGGALPRVTTDFIRDDDAVSRQHPRDGTAYLYDHP
ncbi:Inner membrane transport permease ybhS [Hafnia alvei]|uniref:Inner membrane transport permease ybhS n=1 Tax=Hafnia alvei TaxID=569 RepID=A0A377PL46_HAFAL|nr:Inner membrane transport permease ybhS [Hafnia alvei]